MLSRQLCMTYEHFYDACITTQATQRELIMITHTLLTHFFSSIIFLQLPSLRRISLL